jgi:hypothetical protein
MLPMEFGIATNNSIFLDFKIEIEYETLFFELGFNIQIGRNLSVYQSPYRVYQIQYISTVAALQDQNHRILDGHPCHPIHP